MAVTDDAFELVRDLAELKKIAEDSGNTELRALAVRISDRTGRLSRKLTDLLEEREHLDPNKDYKLGSPGPTGPAGARVTGPAPPSSFNHIMKSVQINPNNP